jgi:histidine triad (HIT) family protein
MIVTNCVFCQIIKKEAKASVVYEDDQVMAFLSNHPVNVGHTLVVPKKHYVNIFDIPEQEATHLFTVVKRVASAVRPATATEGIRIVQNNGADAGQVVFHLHVHIIPLKPSAQSLHEHSFRAAEQLDRDAEKIRQKITLHES